MGRNCRFLQGAHTNKATIDKIREAVHNPKSIEVEILNYRKDGVAFWNNFLMLPVFKNKKCVYFIAIQKNITIFKRDNPPKKWTPAEVAMWLESYGLYAFSKKIISSDINGKKILKCNQQTLLSCGIILRSDQEDILKAVEYLKENYENPFAFKNNNQNQNRNRNNNDSLNEENEDLYAPQLLDSVNLSVNSNKPNELSYWEREGSPIETVLFKIYYHKEILMLLWPTSTLSKDVIESEISTHFELKHIKLHYIDVDLHNNSFSKSSTIIYSDDQFNEIVKTTKGTIKFIIEEEEKDILSLTSTLNCVPDAIFIINDALEVLYSNRTANLMFAVKNASFIPNLTKILPELPINFPKYNHIQTSMITPKGNIPVNITVSLHGNNSFMFIIRPMITIAEQNVCTTDSFDASIIERSSKTDPSSNESLQLSSLELGTDVENETVHSPRLTLEDHSEQNIEDSLDDDIGEDNGDEDDDHNLSSSTPLSCRETNENNNNDIKPKENRTIKEGDVKQLGRTLDQILFSSTNNMIELFLTSYKLFHSKETVLDELYSLFNYYFNDKTASCFLKDEKQEQIKIATVASDDLINNFSRNFCYLLEKWTEFYPSDFNSICFRDHFISLIEKFPNTNQINSIKLQMIKSLKRKGSSGLVERFTLDIISYTSSQDIANALTAKDMIIFKQIRAEEFYRCAWMKKDKIETSPNIIALSSSFEEITSWISISILVDNIKIRTKRIQKFIDIANRLLRQNNFHTMMAVVSALDVCHVSRLKKTWATISQQSLNLLKEMKYLMDSGNNFRQYRKALQNVINSPDTFAIPYFPVILRDLTFTFESLSSDCTFDNIELIGKQLQIIRELQSRDLPSDEFKVKDSLLHFFSTVGCPNMNEEELYQTSLTLEPTSSSLIVK